MTLALTEISKQVGEEHHLRGISLDLEPGSFNVLLGRTLAGKTSLLRILAGLDRPTRGRILQGEADITRLPVGKRSVAMVYQQFINYPSFTVRGNIASPLRLAKVKRTAKEIEARVRELGAMLGIEHLFDRLPGELSGGQQQRVAIARALAKDAQLLLLDEPLVNLDYKLREGLRDELRAIFRARETTVVYATTDPAEALALGGQAIVMHEGRVIQHAPMLEAYHRPASATAALVFSDPPLSLFEVEVADGAALHGAELRIPLPAHLRALAPGAYRFGIRASDCTLHAREGLVSVRAAVELNEISGSETFVYLRRGELPFIVQETGVFHHELGAELTFYMNPERLLAFEAGAAGALVASYRAPGAGT